MIQAQPHIDAAQIAANQAAIAAANIAAAAHYGDAGIHFTEASISHANILNVGTNSHAVIDSHIADTGIHYGDAPADSMDYVRRDNAWVQATIEQFGEYRGTFDASGGSFPVAVNQGDWYNCTVAGTVDGQAFIVGDLLVALVDTPSTTTFAGNWTIVPNISVTDHTALTNIGVNTHAQIDTHLAAVNNPHTVTLQQAFDAGNTMASTTEGLGIPVMTTLQRQAIANAAGLIVFDSDIGQVHQNTGAGWTIPGAGLTTLAGAYNNDPTMQITVNATPDPVTIQASVAGNVFEVLDIAGNDILQVTANPDVVNVQGAFTITDAFLNGAAPTSLVLADTFTTGGGFLGGGILSNGTVTYDNSFFIWALLQESKVYRAAAGPGFAAFTLFNALAAIENSGNFDLVQALILNNGLSHRRITSGTSVTTQTIGLANSPSTRSTVSGAIMTKSVGDIAVRHSPTFSTVPGSTVNLGTQIGLDLIQPLVALFQTQTGIENMTAYYGVNMGTNPTFGGASAVYSIVRSVMNAGTNKRFLDNTGTAESRLVGPLNMAADFPNGLLRFGASNDVTLGYVGGTNEFFMQLVTPTISQMRFSSPATDRILIQHALGAGEFNINCATFSMGAQSGAVGNQVGVFAAGTRTMTVGGGWSDFLLTQAGNITVDAAAGQLFGWTINAPSITLGTGSVVDAGGLLLGGNVTQGTNRYGLLVLSSPTGGTLNYCARFQGAAGVLVDGLFEHAGSTLGFYGATPITVPTVTGSRGGNAALADLLTDLANLGLIVDGTSA